MPPGGDVLPDKPALREVLQGWLEFLQLFVAKQVPDTTGLRGLYPAVAGQITKDNEGAAEMPIPCWPRLIFSRWNFDP